MASMRKVKMKAPIPKAANGICELRVIPPLNLSRRFVADNFDRTMGVNSDAFRDATH